MILPRRASFPPIGFGMANMTAANTRYHQAKTRIARAERGAIATIAPQKAATPANVSHGQGNGPPAPPTINATNEPATAGASDIVRRHPVDVATAGAASRTNTPASGLASEVRPASDADSSQRRESTTEAT